MSAEHVFYVEVVLLVIGKLKSGPPVWGGGIGHVVRVQEVAGEPDRLSGVLLEKSRMEKGDARGKRARIRRGLGSE